MTKRLLLIFLLLIPIAQAQLVNPYFEVDGIEYEQEVSSVTQIGGVPYVEVYTKEDRCPIIFQRNTEGKKIPHFPFGLGGVGLIFFRSSPHAI